LVTHARQFFETALPKPSSPIPGEKSGLTRSLQNWQEWRWAFPV
jgi:hypothetical protein